MARRRTGYIQIDVSEVLDELDDVDLVEELKSRGIDAGMSDDGLSMAREAYEELCRGRPLEARAVLERLLFPKWTSRDNSRNAYDMFRKGAQQ